MQNMLAVPFRAKDVPSAEFLCISIVSVYSQSSCSERNERKAYFRGLNAGGVAVIELCL
jgi:hypothetical protein